MKKIKRKAANNKKGKLILFVGDEGAILVHINGATVLRRLYAPASDPDSTLALKETIEANPETPIFMLVDMIDQSYVKHTLPPVAQLSVQKLIKRRLERDFAPEDITGALPLGRETEGRKDWNYLLVALANSPQLMAWFEFLVEFENRLNGIYLAPAEGQNLIKALSALNNDNTPKEEGDKEKASWKLLVLHNKVGGFRQIITKNDRLVFTRLTQPIGETLPEVVAGNIEQEISNTIEYLKRLGYNDEIGLDLFVIVSQEIKGAIDSAKFKTKSTHLYSPHEAGISLGIENAALPEDHYADVIFAAFFGIQKRYVLKLQNRKSAKLNLYYLSKDALKWGTSIAATALVGYSLYNGYYILTNYTEIAEIEDKKRRIERTLAESVENSKTKIDNIDQVIDVVSIHEKFSENSSLPLEFVNLLGQELRPDIIVRNLIWKNESTLESRAQKTNENLLIQVEVEFLDNTRNAEETGKYAKSFINALQQRFPAYDITHSDLPGTIRRDETFQASFNEKGENNRNANRDEPVLVTITLKSNPNKQASYLLPKIESYT